MLQNAYFLANIGADTAENEQDFAEILPIGRRVAHMQAGRLVLPLLLSRERSVSGGHLVRAALERGAPVAESGRLVGKIGKISTF